MTVAVEQLPASRVYPHPDARTLDAGKVNALAESIRECGLLSPIVVRKKVKRRNGVETDVWEILAGHHRYAACTTNLKAETVPCIVLEADDLHAELISIDENLCRANLSPAQEAYQTARRKEIYEALHPQTRHGVAGAVGKHVAVAKLATASGSQVDRFTAETAAATGKSERSVQRAAARGDSLGEDLRRVAGTSLDKRVELDALASLPPEDREEIVARAERGERVSAREPKPAKLADDPLNDFEAKEAQVDRLMRAWNKAGPEAREEFLGRIDRPVTDTPLPTAHCRLPRSEGAPR